MTSTTIGLLIGGLIPAVAYAFTQVCQRAGVGLGVALYLTIVGLTVAVTGGVLLLFDRSAVWSGRLALFAVGNGFFFAVGTGLVSVAILKYHTPMAKLVPLYNMNTLIGVLLILWIFAEWKQVKPLQLLIGALLIMIGGTLVARA